MAEEIANVISPSLVPGSSTVNGKEVIVGIKHEVKAIMERLIGNSKCLERMSIVGMPGLGKTTLVHKVYNDLYIAQYFYICASLSISQVYQKRDLLIAILSSSHIHPTKDIHKMSDEELSERLHKRLMGSKYLIVMDDIWSVNAWNDLKLCFLNDNNGSRILFTSRIIDDDDLHAKLSSVPYNLRLLSKEESWNLLHDKIFPGQVFPQELIQLGMKIVEKCQGLPLSIVVVAGLLAKTEKTETWWNQVAASISSYIASDPKICIETLELSYTHLPELLKPCFLYFGVFPEDYEILVSKLIWLWVAEGFVVKSEKNPRLPSRFVLVFLEHVFCGVCTH